MMSDINISYEIKIQDMWDTKLGITPSWQTGIAIEMWQNTMRSRTEEAQYVEPIEEKPAPKKTFHKPKRLSTPVNVVLQQKDCETCGSLVLYTNETPVCALCDFKSIRTAEVEDFVNPY